MTNEEAIKMIEMAIAEVEWNYPMDYAVAFEMAIEALKNQESFEKGVDICVDTMYNIDTVKRTELAN